MNAFNQTQNTLIVNHVEKADTIFRRMKGLLGKKTMPNDYGLWIQPCHSIHTFFMQFPIDVVFLSSNNHVVGQLQSLRPFRLSQWFHSAQSVLELSEGTIQRGRIHVGDQITFSS